MTIAEALEEIRAVIARLDSGQLGDAGALNLIARILARVVA